MLATDGWDHGGVTQPAAPASAPGGRPPRGRGTGWDMVRSLLVVGAVVAAVVLLIPRPGEPVRQPVDVAAEAALARDQVEFDVVVPDVGWEPNGAGLEIEGDEAVPTWHVGYVTPSGRYAGVDVAESATASWLREVTSEGVETGTLDVAGAPWVEWVSDDGERRSLVLDADGVTTVVGGTATLDELVELAEASTP